MANLPRVMSQLAQSIIDRKMAASFDEQSGGESSISGWKLSAIGILIGLRCKEPLGSRGRGTSSVGR